MFHSEGSVSPYQSEDSSEVPRVVQSEVSAYRCEDSTPCPSLAACSLQLQCVQALVPPGNRPAGPQRKLMLADMWREAGVDSPEPEPQVQRPHPPSDFFGHGGPSSASSETLSRWVKEFRSNRFRPAETPGSERSSLRASSETAVSGKPHSPRKTSFSEILRKHEEWIIQTKGGGIIETAGLMTEGSMIKQAEVWAMNENSTQKLKQAEVWAMNEDSSFEFPLRREAMSRTQ